MFDSWAGHLPKDQYETFAMPYQKRVVEAIKAKHPTTPVIIYMAPDIHQGRQFLDLLATTGVNCVFSTTWTLRTSARRCRIIWRCREFGPEIMRDGP